MAERAAVVAVFEANSVTDAAGRVVVPEQLLEYAMEELGIVFSAAAATGLDLSSCDLGTFQQLVDAMRSAESSLQERLAAAFAECDVERNGYLGEESFVALLSTSPDVAVTEADARVLMTECDADNDGRVSLADILAFVCRQQRAVRSRSTRAEELRATMTQLEHDEAVDRRGLEADATADRETAEAHWHRQRPALQATGEGAVCGSHPSAPVAQGGDDLTAREQVKQDGGCCIVA